MLRNSVNSVFTLKIAIGTIVMALILLSGVGAAQEISWHVLVGGETTDMSLQGLGFYPGVITINAGDSINWTMRTSEPHTVSFLSGDSIPEPGSPPTLLPAGDFNYNGTGHVSSGIMLQGMSYTLNFTEPGVYTYQCLLHPGMGGVVIVQPNGSSYPFTQDQYDTQGIEELNADLASGQNLVDNLSISSVPGPNDTTIWQAAADIPLPMNADVVLSQENNSGANAALNFIGPGMLEVQVKLSGLAPNSVHPAHIHAGTCEAGGPIVYPLNNLTADAEGNVTNTTIINGPPWLAIQKRGWFVNVHQGPTMSDGGATPVACGDIEQNYAAYMRFAPDPLTIHTDDTIVWTQMNPMMIHTVTFPVAGQPVPEFILPDFSINPVAAIPAGGSVYNGTDFFNSGILPPGQNYNLTFTKPGTYDYLCLIHDEMGMIGKVIVLPPEEQVNNLIKNPGFESGKQNWIFYTNGTGRLDIISPGFEGNNAAEVKITSVGSNIQLYQKGLTLEPNTHYRLSFAAKSSSGHDVSVSLLKHSSPFTNYGLRQHFDLTTDWQTFTTEFDTKGFTGTVEDGRLMFYIAPFGRAGDKYYFDFVKLEEVQ